MAVVVSSQIDLALIEREAASAPLRGIETVLDVFGVAKDETARNQLRRILCASAFRHLGITDFVDSEKDIFDPTYNDQVRHFIAVCLLRFLAYSDVWGGTLTTFRGETFKLLDACFSRQLYGFLKIDSKKQAFEKERVLRAYVLGTEGAVATSLSALDHLGSEHWEGVSIALHDLKRALGKAKLIISPVVDKDMISGARIEELSTAVQDYFLAAEGDAIEAYQNCKSVLEKYLLQAQKRGDRYSRDYLASLALKLLQLCISRFEKSGIIAPASLVLKPPEKRYPLYAENLALNFSFVLDNNGPGYAFDVFFRIKSIDDGVELSWSELFLGDLGPRPISVEFPVVLRKPARKCFGRTRMGMEKF